MSGDTIFYRAGIKMRDAGGSILRYVGRGGEVLGFTLMVNNCLSYNERDTIFYRAGIKMRDAGGSILRYVEGRKGELPPQGQQLSVVQ